MTMTFFGLTKTQMANGKCRCRLRRWPGSLMSRLATTHRQLQLPQAAACVLAWPGWRLVQTFVHFRLPPRALDAARWPGGPPVADPNSRAELGWRGGRLMVAKDAEWRMAAWLIEPPSHAPSPCWLPRCHAATPSATPDFPECRNGVRGMPTSHAQHAQGQNLRPRSRNKDDGDCVCDD